MTRELAGMPDQQMREAYQYTVQAIKAQNPPQFEELLDNPKGNLRLRPSTGLLSSRYGVWPVWRCNDTAFAACRW